MASAEEVAALLPPTDVPLFDEEDEALLDDEALTSALEGTTSEERALQELELRVEGDAALIKVRPRDYRVLEARPVRR